MPLARQRLPVLLMHILCLNFHHIYWRHRWHDLLDRQLKVAHLLLVMPGTETVSAKSFPHAALKQTQQFGRLARTVKCWVSDPIALREGEMLRTDRQTQGSAAMFFFRSQGDACTPSTVHYVLTRRLSECRTSIAQGHDADCHMSRKRTGSRHQGCCRPVFSCNA